MAVIEHYSQLYPNTVEVANQEDLYNQIKSLIAVITSEEKESIGLPRQEEDKSAITTFIPQGTKLNLTDARSFVCLDTRSREIRNTLKSEHVFPIVRSYPTTNGLQCFISFEDEFGNLY